MLERVIHRLRKSEKAYAAKVRIMKNEIRGNSAVTVLFCEGSLSD